MKVIFSGRTEVFRLVSGREKMNNEIVMVPDSNATPKAVTPWSYLVFPSDKARMTTFFGPFPNPVTEEFVSISARALGLPGPN